MPTLNFKGKTFVQNHHLAVKYHQLIPKSKLSLTDKVSLHDNLIIQGDNLKALKALLPNYAGKIKCIYIDPPYNTGNENWVYNDNVNSPMIKEWLGQVVDKEDMTCHDKWLCMMMPRLKLLRELLSEDGAIFISCDDNEVQNLKVLLDEIFGEENFVACIAVQVNKGGRDYLPIAITHEYLLCYYKSEEGNLNELRKDISNFKYEDKKGKYELRELRNRNPKFNSSNRPNLFYPIYINPLSKSEEEHCFVSLTKSKDYSIETYPLNSKGEEGCWRWGKELAKKNISENFDTTNIVAKSKNGNSGWNVYEKSRKSTSKAKSIWDESEVRTEQGTIDLREIEMSNSMFQFPKPVYLIKKVIQLVTNENDIILDSFAGSGTTAHAVLELNKEDGGNRKFILVEQEDYANTITAERVRRVIKGVKTDKNENLKNGTGGTFSYFQLGEPIEMESLLRGKNLPTYTEFARYVFYTATGEEFNEKTINEKTGFIGESRNYEVYLLYKPDVEWLKRNALTLEICQSMSKFKRKQRLVFAPCKYIDDETCQNFRIDFQQLPYEIFRIQR